MNGKIKKTLALFVVAAMVFMLGGCEDEYNRTDSRPEGNLFDKEVLEYFDIPWLIPPENATDEYQYTFSNDYHYRAAISGLDAFNEYAAYVLQSLSEAGYLVVRHSELKSQGELFTYEQWVLASESNVLSDFIYWEKDEGIQYLFYYTKYGTGKYDEEHGGKRMRIVTAIYLYYNWPTLKELEEDQINITIIDQRYSPIYLVEDSANDE